MLRYWRVPSDPCCLLVLLGDIEHLLIPITPPDIIIPYLLHPILTLTF